MLSFPVFAQNWSLVNDMAPVEAQQSDYGVNMVFAGDYLVVSWPKIFEEALAPGAQPSGCGEIITYEKVNGQYQSIASTTAEDLTGSCVPGDGFGYGLAFDQGRLAIGMPAGTRAGMNLSGGGSDADSRVFITHFENGQWVLDETLQADDLGGGRGMGFQLVMEGDLLLVHAHEYDSIFGFSFVVSTGVYVFEDSGNGFNQTQKLTENFHLFGQDFDTENGQIVVGAWGEQTLTAPGRVYVYENQGGNWQLAQTINDSRNSNLGNQIEIDGSLMAVGAVQAGGIGSVVVFENNNGQWQERQLIQADDADFNDQFGIAVRIRGDDLLIGATGGTDSGTTSGANVGAVYHFVKQVDGMFIQQQKLESLESNEGNDQFAGNLIFNETDLLVNETSGGTLDGASTEFAHFSRAGTTNPPVQSQVDNTTSGVWMADGVANQSMSIQILNNNQALLYVRANHQGEDLWLLGLGQYNDNHIDVAHLYTTSGARFGGAFDSADVQLLEVGTAIFSLTACDTGDLMFDLGAIGSGEIKLDKTHEISGNECGVSNKNLPNGVSGSWFDPGRSGEGFTVYVFEQSGVQQAEVTWYTYDETGAQMTLQGVGPVADQTISIDAMKRVTGAEFLSGIGSEQTMGSLQMSWDGCRLARMDYDLTAGQLGQGGSVLSQINDLNNTSCGDLDE